jgi:hypothetical protein
VRDDDDRPRLAVRASKRSSEREPVEVEVVRRLVEQEQVGIRVEDRAQRLAAAPRPRAPAVALLREVLDRRTARAGDVIRRLRLLEAASTGAASTCRSVRADDADPRDGRHVSDSRRG